MDLKVKPISRALGAELSNVDLGALSAEVLQAVDQALLKHSVLFFRNQNISHQNHLDFARHWDDVQTHPAYPTVAGFPEITVLENDPDNEPKIEQWHTDITFRPEPPLGSILRAVVVPPTDAWSASPSRATDLFTKPFRALQKTAPSTTRRSPGRIDPLTNRWLGPWSHVPAVPHDVNKGLPHRPG